ncbi:MAG: AsmA-like C-terminal region-containing protein, partial [Chitinophagaceae bacterium]
DLITKINTQSLSFIFEKNDLLINQLPVNFKGNFSFLSNGYDMNFDVQSEATQLYNVLTALPIEYIQHFKKVDLKGTADMYLNLSGKYIAETNTMPGLTAAIGIRSGFIKEEKAPAPISNLFLNFQAKLPSFDKEQMEIAVDSLFFNIDKDYFSTVTRIKGFSKPHIYTKTDANISLEKWNKALGELPFTVKGNLGMQLNANGYWAEKVVQRNLRKQDTITSSIPVFDGKLALQNGYFKWANLPKAIENIYCSVKANCKDSIYQHAELQIDSVHLQAGSNFVKGKATLKGKQQWHTQAKFDGNLALQELKDIIHLPGYELGGNISLQMLVNGILAIEKQVYPIAKAHIEWQNGLLKTPYYPNAIEKIQVETDIVSKSNSPKQVSIAVKPIAFSFENQPFTLKANLSNLNNLKYDLSSKGKIDIGKIYKVFAYQGWDVQGIIATNLQLKGLQSDATAGLYEKLTNKGFIKVQNLWLNSYLYPHPFVISNGKFSFLQDKCWFDSVQARYQKSDFGVKGYVTNMVNYWLKNETIEGGFEVYSNNLAVDEFMAFAETQTGISTKNATKEGVIMLPKNMHLSLVAHAKKVNYMGLGIQNLEGNVKVEKGKLLLKNTSFSVAGANANMEGSYQSLSPWKAQFDYQVKLDNFDIQRVYKEVTLIQQLASSTKFIKGNASLNYLLSGKINKEMMPIFPSLKGNGSIEATNVSILGMKLFTAV